MFRPLQLIDPANSGCWNCADTPCIRFNQNELNRKIAIPSPSNPELRVCPTDALQQGEGGPQVDKSNCIGCGLCVVRCPVGAAYLDAESALPVFAELRTGSSVSEPDFARSRDAAMSSISWEAAPFADVDKVVQQLVRFRETPKANLQQIFRLLVRNSFLASGNVARLSIVGDNSAWAEVAVGMDPPLSSPVVGAVQIEPDDVGLDAIRRLMAGAAVAISRHGLTKGSLIPIVAVVAQPNSRTDYYRLIADARAYLDIHIRTVPLAMLLLAIRNQSRSFLETLLTEDIGLVDVNNPRNEHQVAKLYGTSARTIPGLSPVK